MRAVLLPALLGLSLILAACNESSTEPTEAPAETSRAAGPTAQALSTVHPFVGDTVNLVLISSDAVTQCLDIQWAPLAYALAQVHPCHNGPNQRFIITAAPTAQIEWNGRNWVYRYYRDRPDLVVFKSAVDPSLCLDVIGATALGGEQVQLFPCHYQSNQAFRLPTPIPGSQSPTYGGLDTEISGYHMRLEAGTGSQPLIRQQPSNTLARQKWGFQLVRDGTRL